MLLFTQVTDVTGVIDITDIIIDDITDIIINDITDKTGVPDVAGQREISC